MTLLCRGRDDGIGAAGAAPTIPLRQFQLTPGTEPKSGSDRQCAKPKVTGAGAGAGIAFAAFTLAQAVYWWCGGWR